MLDGYWNLIILLVTCWMLQIAFSYLQHKDYQKVINENKYRQSGFLGVGVAKAKFNLGRGAVLIVVTDHLGTILDFQEMSGITVLSRFKKIEQYIGKNAATIMEDMKNRRRIEAFEQALSLIEKEKSKMEE